MPVTSADNERSKQYFEACQRIFTYHHDNGKTVRLGSYEHFNTTKSPLTTILWFSLGLPDYAGIIFEHNTLSGASGIMLA